jgi:hypothetical protein
MLRTQQNRKTYKRRYIFLKSRENLQQDENKLWKEHEPGHDHHLLSLVEEESFFPELS